MSEDALEALDRMIDEDSRRRQEEIDRLRARIAELETNYNRLHGQSIALTAELAEAKRNRITEEQIDRLRTRIAELERTNETMSQWIHETCGASLEGGWITEEQIDAAWEYRGINAMEATDDALADLGIVACPKCGGSRVLYSFITNQATPCPACYRNGKSHGWVWKETTDV